jgi:hypothetical protein
MKTDWRAYPDHIGHKYYPGCYRCHDGKHKTAGGIAIRHECSLCHEFMEQRSTEKGEETLVRGGYHHPYKLEGAHAEAPCYACHTGGPTPPPTCKGCHAGIALFQEGVFEGMPSLEKEPIPHNEYLDCTDCHTKPAPIEKKDIMPSCMFCHDEKFRDKLTGLFKRTKTKRSELLEKLRQDQQRKGSPASLDIPGVLHRLDRIGAVHNLPLAEKILDRLLDEAGKGDA